MPAAVCRTSPARSISLWLTICASEGLSLRTGRKARDHRMAAALAVIHRRWQPRARRRACCCAPDTAAAEKQPWTNCSRDKALAPGLLTLVRTNWPWVGFGVWLGDWGRPLQRHPRGLTSNRHAGRPDRWPIRAFAFAATWNEPG